MVCLKSSYKKREVLSFLLVQLVGSLTPESVEPCAASPLCSCRPATAHMSCIALPLHRFPEWIGIELQHLDISMSALQVVPESALDGLRLQTLLLVANKLHHIEPSAFSSMSETLSSLDLGFNEFTEIPLQAMRNLKSLSWLNLQNNNIAQVDTNTNWHYLGETLTSLSLANNQIYQLKSQALTSLHRLLLLDLEGNHLRTIDKDSLPPSLTQIKLSNNFLSEISCDLILSLPRLQALHLKHNYMAHDKLSYCKNKSHKIERIDLSYNKLNDSSKIHLLTKIKIRQIILDHNELTNVPQIVYKDNRVERLTISNNKLNLIYSEFFLSLKHSLEQLEMDHNMLSQLPDSLSQATRLRHLSLAYNQFTSSPPLPRGIQALSLSGNLLTSLPTSLQALKPGSIRYLDLSYNSISSLSPNEFLEWSTSLVTINLRGNRISQIHNNVFPANMPVKEINLSFNDLYYVHPQSFSNVTSSLHVLEFSTTMFSGYFPFEVSEPIDSVGWLSFDNNDFHILKLSDLVVFPYLKYLNLDYNIIVDIIPGHFNIGTMLSLTSIRLAYNFLTSIKNETFVQMPDLQNIDLSYNRISKLTKNSFTNLFNLRYLSFEGNSIDFIEAETFCDLPQLEIITLHNNNLSLFSLEAFKNISSFNTMLTLNISRNNVKHISGSSQIPICVFDLSYNDFEEVPNNSFVLMESSIRHIDLSHNKITYIDSRAFGESKNLQIINLRKNNITAIKRKSFSDLLSLQILDLSFNVLSQLAVELFLNLNKLRFLKLDHNILTTIPRDVFKNTIIEHLDLSHNELTLFPVTALSQIGFTLRYLDLSHNYLKFVDSSIFKNIQFLVNLKLDHNLLTVFSDNTFSCLGGLRELDLSFNSLKANFKELFHNVPNLRHLNLANTNLKSVPYLPLTNLTFLNLTSNSINSFKEVEVKGLANLRHLDLSHNRITSVVPNMWAPLINLIVLDVSYNPILKITSNCFLGLSNLSHLNLNGLTSLSVINYDSFRPLISLRSLHIETWSSINHSKFRICNITNYLPTLFKLTIHWTDKILDKQLHEVDTRNLHYLDIRGINLRRISDEAFEAFAESQEMFLKISETSLNKLPLSLMKHLGQIPQLGLDVSYNQLSTLNPVVLYPNYTSWSHVATKLLSGGLILSGNSLRCGCGVGWLGAWLRRWLQENDAAEDLRQAVKSATCEDQFGRSHPLLQIRADEADCHASALSSDAEANIKTPSLLHIAVLVLWNFILR